MPVRNASAVWTGTLAQGNGIMRLGSGAFEGQYSYASRFEEGSGTNPEELIGAAHAGCFSQAFSLELENAGYKPQRIQTVAEVTLNKTDSGFAIQRIKLNAQAEVPEIDDDTLLSIAENAKNNCPVSKALAGVEIELTLGRIG